MYGLLTSLFNQHFGSPTYNICLLGPEETGKTTLFTAIKHIDEIKPHAFEHKPAYKPTVGLNMTKYQNGDDKFKVWDLGGRANLRKIWQSYYSQCHGLIFLIDKRQEQSLNILKNVLSHQQMAKIPVVIILTEPSIKENVQYSIKHADWMEERQYIIQQLNLNFLSSKTILRDLLHWLYFNVRQLHNSLKE